MVPYFWIGISLKEMDSAYKNQEVIKKRMNGCEWMDRRKAGVMGKRMNEEKGVWIEGLRMGQWGKMHEGRQIKNE